jgi:hypothetical protein
MWGFDLHGWETTMLVSLGFAAVAAIAVVIATTVVVRLQHVEAEDAKRELEAYKANATAKISSAEAVGQAAKAEVAMAQAQIEEAKARQKEAELKLEQLRERMRPRSIKGERFLNILAGRPRAPVEILFVKDDPDCFQLSMQIRDYLKQADWQVAEPRAIESSDLVPRLSKYTSTMGVGGQPHGVTVVLRATSQYDFTRERDENPLDPNRPLDTPRKVLTQALGDSLGSIAGGISFETGAPGFLWVVVGPKQELN